jgi:hypothetical protein
VRINLIDDLGVQTLTRKQDGIIYIDWIQSREKSKGNAKKAIDKIIKSNPGYTIALNISIDKAEIKSDVLSRLNFWLGWYSLRISDIVFCDERVLLNCEIRTQNKKGL